MLIYGTVSNQAWYDAVFYQVHGYSQGGRLLKAVSCSSGGNTNPATAHARYMQQRNLNIAYNNTWGDQEGRLYPTAPMLILLGDPGVAPFLDTDCEDCGTCGLDGCVSYGLIADTDEDHVQDGPVSVIPCRTDEEVAEACQMADDWNAGRFRDPNRGVAVFAGDRHSGGVAAPRFRRDAELLYGRLWTSINAGRGFRAYTDMPYPPPAGSEGQVGEDVLDTGVSELWTFGLGTWSNHLPFTVPNVGSALKQRILIIAPTCRSADFHMYETNTLQEFMFRPAEQTVAAGGIGVLRSGYGDQHSALIDALSREMIVAPAGRTYAQIALDAARTVAERYPGYASTVTTFGAYLVCPAGLAPAGVEGEAPRSVEALRARSMREGSRLWLGVRSPVSGAGRIEVFDADGRRVAGTDVAGLRIGWNERVLDLARGSRGVYFVTLRAGVGGGRPVYRAKVVIVE